MDVIEIRYCFNFDKQRHENVNLQLDAHSLEIVNKPCRDLPEWTKLEFHRCPHCPLDSETHPNCPVAVSLASVIGRFENVCSHDEVDLEVIIDERHVSQHTTAQRGICSLLGLLFATSSCPHTTFLKPMARFHLPLASEEDTIFRATGMYLLAQYFLKKEGKESDLELAGLKLIYDNLHLVNTMIAKRIKSITQTDSSVNAVILLDMFTNLMPFAIEDHLNEIRHLFDSYLSGSNK
ncbi:MAG: hypothetical protein BMS9Abin36_1918 [Gammaproteobacteria bacterium]|nr:MAG: hypothetical protein BMS9Abin36_1918 [Gammaproteobacteria bacterium]